MQNYLERIGIYNEVAANLHSLKLIQKQHLLMVPFENLDIHMYGHLKTDFSSLYDKIVKEKRGGICYEINWLLYHLLVDIGFSVKVLGGKVLDTNGSYFDHLLLVVKVYGKEYLVDVGFGDNFLEPLEFKEDVVQKDYKGLFKIEAVDEVHYELKKYSKEIDEFETMYIIKNVERKISDFNNRVDYFIHSNESIFKKNLFCSLEKVDGRISLKHDKLILTQNDLKTVREMSSSSEYIFCLIRKFKISLNLNQQKRIKNVWENYY